MLKYDEQKFKNICISGDYHQVISYLSDLDDANDLLEKYRDIYERGAYILEAEDESILEFLRPYEEYLKWALTNETNKISRTSGR